MDDVLHSSMLYASALLCFWQMPLVHDKLLAANANARHAAAHQLLLSYYATMLVAGRMRNQQ
jgi:hypothetical protein